MFTRSVWCCVAAVLTGVVGSAAGQAEGEASPIEVAEPKPFFDFSSWDGEVELGLSGSDGNTERFNLRAALGLERNTEEMETSLGFSFRYATEDGDETENRFLFTGRNDWLFGDTPWRAWVQASIDVDEFQEWDTRWSIQGGPGYTVIDNDKTEFVLRAGLGLTQTVGGGSENKIVPEAVAGFDLNHQLSERQKLYLIFDFYPTTDEFGPYRFIAEGGWEILVDPELNMTLKLGFEDRYDSSPGEGFKRNDIDYFATLVWAF